MIFRSRMSKAEFEEYLKTHYEYWFSSYYTYLDEKLIEYLMQELFRIQAMYARQDIALELKLNEIY